MALSAGDRLGPYEIVGPIGAGGMGEVYRARDARLSREVAVKILPASVVNDADRLRRFEVEARAVGQLNHPNILTVHDTGLSGRWSYLVTELLEGETLRTRLDRGPIARGAALDFAGQIARGLQAAHAKGVVHRDLKPENLFVTSDNRIKILDFGLAKLTLPLSREPSAETVSVPHTEPGVVMGTAGYMSPEQVRGDVVDHRTDLFAFGAILYEMLTGTSAFQGATTVEIMTAVLRHPVPVAALSEDVLPAALGRIIDHCLEKVAPARFQSAGDLAFSLEMASSGPSRSAIDATTRSGPVRAAAWPGRLGWIAALVLGLVATWLAVSGRRGSFEQHTVSASVLPPEKSIFDTVIVSPDGRRLAFTDGQRQLWIRALDEPVPAAQPLAGASGATNPFWSADGRSLGFFAENQLKVVDIAGGLPRTITDVADNRGGSWSRDNVIVFGRDIGGPLYRVSASGGPQTQATTLGPNEGTHRWPQFLPDGRHFLYFVRSTDEEHVGTYVASLDNPAGRRVLATVTNAVFAPPGFLLYVRDDGALMAQPFDIATLTTSGAATQLAPKAGLAMQLNRSTVSVSQNGVLVYGSSDDRQAVWFDRSGNAQDPVGSSGSFSSISLGSGDHDLVGERPNPRTGANDIVLINLLRGAVESRLTVNPVSDTRPVWVPVTNLVVYASNRTGGVYDLCAKPASGAGDEEVLYASPESKFPTGASPDGRFLFFERADPRAKTSLWALSMADKTVFPLLETGFNEAQARMSPDGRWIAFVSDREGSSEVYVAEASGLITTDAAARRRAAASSVRVSAHGGVQPLWRRDRKQTELYFLAPDRRLMAVSFTGGPGPVGAPTALFETRASDVSQKNQAYAAASDGQRFLITVRVEETGAATIVLNWASMLQK